MKKILSILLLSLACVITCPAQRMDYGTIEALIGDHKKIIGPILARTSVEMANKELHNNSKDRVLDYKDVNEQLDKYTRCFDILNIVYTGLSTTYNIYNTTTDISNKIVEIKDLLERYRACIIAKQLGQLEDAKDLLTGVKDINSISGAKEWYRSARELYNEGTVIDANDTIIFTVGRDMVLGVNDKMKDITKSFSTLVDYAIGAQACTTEGLLVTIQGLDNQITELRQIVDRGYFLLWRYIHMRTGYWSKPLIRQHKSVREHAQTALKRWRVATLGKMKNGTE